MRLVIAGASCTPPSRSLPSSCLFNQSRHIHISTASHKHTYARPGGYDAAVQENVEYLAELQAQARALGLLPTTQWDETEGDNDDAALVSFRPSISDAERAALLQDALCVIYTPDREHFGIVPLEVGGSMCR